jgi:hypothetical protein
MKKTILLLALAILAQACISAQHANSAYSYEGSDFGDIWHKISELPYSAEERPTRGLTDLVKEVVARRFVKTGQMPNASNARNTELVKRANQTLNDRADYYEDGFTKMVHANGICLKGSWNMTHANPYSGYFEKGKSSPMIARASVALFDTNKDQYRGFGLAGKIYPASDETIAGPRIVKTANFFTVHDLGGERNVLFNEVSFTNQPPATFHLTLLRYLSYAWNVIKSFRNADANNGNATPNPGVRQLFEISELGLSEDQALTAITPRCLRIKTRFGQSNDKSDFRDELNLADYPKGKLIMDVYAQSPESDTECGALLDAQWIGKKVGYIEFTESVASASCDTQLHFHHPKWKEIRYFR